MLYVPGPEKTFLNVFIVTNAIIEMKSLRFCRQYPVNTSGEAVRGLVKSRVGFTRASPIVNSLAGFAREYSGSAARSPTPESRQLRRLAKSVGFDIVGA